MFDDEFTCMKAAAVFRDAGYKKFDAITPFPVHGMEEAIGIKRSPIPYVTFIFALTGASLALGFQYWTSAVSWPIIVGGQPFFSIPSFMPITFELTVLLGALSSVAAMFILNKLPKVDPPVLHPDLTSHRFAIWVPETEEGFSYEKIEKILDEHGAKEIKKGEF